LDAVKNLLATAKQIDDLRKENPGAKLGKAMRG